MGNSEDERIEQKETKGTKKGKRRVSGFFDDFVHDCASERSGGSK
jgi:hypothetical protein